jgi:hypothetical protein
MEVSDASPKEGREQKGKGRREKAKKESKGLLLRFEMSTLPCNSGHVEYPYSLGDSGV